MSKSILETFLPKSATRIVVYLKPINTRWGPNKLRSLCLDDMGIPPDHSTCFLFVNTRRDTLLMYFMGFDGPETLTKKLEKGAFLLPAPETDGAGFVILRPAMLARLFRA